MQKNAPEHYPDELFDRHQVPKEDGGVTVYPVVRHIDALPYLANQGVITFHGPPVKVEDPDHPDWVVWDLDPPPGGLDIVREAVRALRSTLEEHAISTVPMTSGSKGYHLRARLVSRCRQHRDPEPSRASGGRTRRTCGRGSLPWRDRADRSTGIRVRDAAAVHVAAGRD